MVTEIKTPHPAGDEEVGTRSGLPLLLLARFAQATIMFSYSIFQQLCDTLRANLTIELLFPEASLNPLAGRKSGFYDGGFLGDVFLCGAA